MPDEYPLPDRIAKKPYHFRTEKEAVAYAIDSCASVLVGLRGRITETEDNMESLKKRLAEIEDGK